MAQLQPIQLDDQSIIYIEATEDVEAPELAAEDVEEEEALTSKGRGSAAVQKQVAQNFKAIQSTIRTYTHYTLNAFKDVATANIEEVTLEFGLKVSGEAGVPYITKGTAESNLKITVKCSFPKPEK